MLALSRPRLLKPVAFLDGLEFLLIAPEGLAETAVD
jgi:hypothetical protein